MAEKSAEITGAAACAEPVHRASSAPSVNARKRPVLQTAQGKPAEMTDVVVPAGHVPLERKHARLVYANSSPRTAFRRARTRSVETMGVVACAVRATTGLSACGGRASVSPAPRERFFWKKANPAVCAERKRFRRRAQKSVLGARGAWWSVRIKERAVQGRFKWVLANPAEDVGWKPQSEPVRPTANGENGS